MYRKRKLLSQNFLLSSSLISKLLERSSIGKNDVVLEIGAGQGIITKQLLKKAGKVIALEIDPKLYAYLKQNIISNNLRLLGIDFKNYSLPQGKYKVFSNVPFSITAQIINKLTSSTDSPIDIYLIVQKEAAEKFAGKPYWTKNSLASILIKPYFELSIVQRFQKTDFYPSPKVNSVLLRIKKRKIPLINSKNRNTFENFVIYMFNQTNSNINISLKKLINKTHIKGDLKPSELTIRDWLALFQLFLENTDIHTSGVVKQFANRYKQNRAGLKKIHRTRLDKNWRSYKSSR